jgi:peroxiredoxin
MTRTKSSGNTDTTWLRAGRQSAWSVLICAFVLCGLAVIARSQARPRVHSSSVFPAVGSESGTNSSAQLGEYAPTFVVTAADGRNVSLSDYKGKALVLNFWATWCEACRREMPRLAELRDKYAPQGFEVLGIVTDRASPEKIASIARRYGVRYPILFCNHATAQAYGGLTELPVSFFVGRHGKIVAEMTGADSMREIESKIKRALSN